MSIHKRAWGGKRAGVGAYSCHPNVPSTYIDHKTIHMLSWIPWRDDQDSSLETHALSDLPIRTLGSYDLSYRASSHDRTEFDRGKVVYGGVPQLMARIG